jgi:hypothetical protein
MSHCSPRCCNGCRTEAREERRILKQEAASISACRSSSFPATVEDADKEEEVSDKPTVSNIPFDIEDGDRVWATGLIPEAQYIHTYLSYSVPSRRSTERLQCSCLTRGDQILPNAQYIPREIHCTILHGSTERVRFVLHGSTARVRLRSVVGLTDLVITHLGPIIARK